MSPIDAYFDTLTPPQKALFEHMRQVVRQTVSPTEDGLSYGMPAIMYRGKALMSFMANKHFLSLYPYSGKTLDTLRDQLADFEGTTGSVHFSEGHPLPDELLKAIVLERKREIEAKPKEAGSL